MVYCGKASLGCSSCRARRIACDLARPQCSQCLRVSKRCPGYRDQLSLMFRDETYKVEQKARASWANDEGPSSSKASLSKTGPRKARRDTISSGQSGTSSNDLSPLDGTSPTKQSRPWPNEGQSFTSQQLSPLTPGGQFEDDTALMVHSKVIWTPAEMGTTYYLNHYIVGYPDEPRSNRDVADQPWFQHSSSQDMVAAVGLAALANIRGDKELHRQARIKYGQALAATGIALRDPVKYRPAGVRTTILLALNEIVVTPHDQHHKVVAHLMGAATLFGHTAQLPGPNKYISRSLLQFCMAVIVPSPTIHQAIPLRVFEILGESETWCPEEDKKPLKLIKMLAEHVQLHTLAQGVTANSGSRVLINLLNRLLAFDEELETWEKSLDGVWLYETVEDRSLPAAAVFRHTYHDYADCWTSRVWIHYRWQRITLCRRIIQLVDEDFNQDQKTMVMITPERRQKLIDTVQKLAVDIMTSAPAHYKDPRLTPAQFRLVQARGDAGPGAGAVPSLMFAVQEAACAPYVPLEISKWGLAMLETVWAEMGMMHAKSLRDVVRLHVQKMEKMEMAAGTQWPLTPLTPPALYNDSVVSSRRPTFGSVVSE